MLLAAHFRRTTTLQSVVGVIWVAFVLAMTLRPAAVADTNIDPYSALVSVALGGDLKLGYALRADTWGGDLPVDGAKRIEHTLLRGNDYRFYAYTTTKGAKISFHIQDQQGTVVETRCWQKEKDEYGFAGADITPMATGSYYLVVKIEQSSAERTEWSLLYAYK